MKQSITFDDVQLVPKYSEILSRNTVSLRSKLSRNFEIEIPIIAAPMDTVCGVKMIETLGAEGAIGILHRFYSEQTQQLLDVQSINKNDANILAVAIGAVDIDLDYIELLLQNNVDILVIDVAHGHHIHVKNALKTLSLLKQDYKFDIIAGSIATAEAALDLQEWGADALRVGVGGGSVCETRIRTGVGVPQLQAIIDIAEVADIPIISDGGIRLPGDAAKALAAGADTVMIGSLLAGTNEAPGELIVQGSWPNVRTYKMYRGLASATTKIKYAGAASHVEGASKFIECKGPVAQIVSDITDGIKSSMSYVGAVNLSMFRTNSEFIQITSSGLAEAHPHLLSK